MRRPRRRFLKNLAGLTLATTVGTRTARAQAESDMNNEDRDTLTLFLCGDVMTGRIKPPACPQFGKGCTPEMPLGALMVSSEGACAAYYQYGGLDLEPVE